MNKVLTFLVLENYSDTRKMLSESLRNSRIPLFLDEDVTIAHKTGTLDGVVNDVGIISYGDFKIFLSVLTDGQADTDKTSEDIGSLAKGIFEIIGGRYKDKKFWDLLFFYFVFWPK